jgi:hypothetical protein
MLDGKILEALEVAVSKAISEMGIARFKQTSFFVSAAAKVRNPIKKAA